MLGRMAKDENRPVDWTKGLPSNEELTSLSHMLISPILASAFRIKRDEPMTEEDVHRESQATLHNLFHQSPNPVFDAFPAYQEQEDEGAYDYKMEGRSNAVELQGKLRVDEQFRGNRDFRGNQREEEDTREEFRGNRQVEEQFRGNRDFRGNQREEEDAREEFRGDRRVEEQFRGNRDFRGNQREEEDPREEFRGNRRVEEQFRGNRDFRGNQREEEDAREEFRGDRRVEEQFSGNRDFRGNQREEEDSREEFRGNRRVEEGFREEFGSNRRVEERRHAVADRMDHPGPSKGDVRSNVGQGLQTNTTAREPDPSTPVEHTRPNTNTQSPGQSSSPYRMNTLPYGPYQPQAENGSTFEMEDTNSGGGAKRARLVWTPQLHKRFVETVGHLGIKNAVPKTIMQLMNVEGLTRENVASHLQKYRLYLKHMQGDDSLSAADHLFASTSVPTGMVPREGPFTMPAIPMQFQGLVRPGPFQSSGERVPYGPGYMEQPAMVPERTQAAVPGKQSTRNNNDQPGSSSQYVLPLFPTN